MPTLEQVPEILNSVEERLDKAAREGEVHLKILRDESKLDDDWLYITVAPTRAGERASIHAELMAEIEKGLRKQGIEHVLILPDVPV